jgi:hypothetical protein
MASTSRRKIVFAAHIFVSRDRRRIAHLVSVRLEGQPQHRHGLAGAERRDQHRGVTLPQRRSQAGSTSSIGRCSENSIMRRALR